MPCARPAHAKSAVLRKKLGAQAHSSESALHLILRALAFATACLLARLLDLTRGIARTAVRPVVQRADIMSFIYETGASARAHVLGDENRPFERIRSFHVGLSWTRRDQIAVSMQGAPGPSAGSDMGEPKIGSRKSDFFPTFGQTGSGYCTITLLHRHGNGRGRGRFSAQLASGMQCRRVRAGVKVVG